MKTFFSSADLALARRMEAAEAATGLAVAEALQAVQPQFQAVAEPFLGGYAVFGGVGSPMTHAMGIGMVETADVAEFDRMEEFFRGRGSASLIDLCPMANASIVRLVQERSYRIIEFNNVLVRALGPGESFSKPRDDIRIRRVDSAEAITWTRVVAQGFFETDTVPDEHITMMSATQGMADCFLATVDGLPAGGAAVGMRGKVASFFGDSTLAAERGQGIQRRLIEQRLAHAAGAGCDLAMVSVLPGSASHRNYQRCGFQLVYMRVNVRREWD
jgi:GNAT superfamily N-acetyltransferase